ncbi:MAG: hypothetical protein JJU11_14385 [Candidatus Sumerlaeia bacterium]|nr:hypothetical protein [Candidatus Sumerlaeia bacterium]
MSFEQLLTGSLILVVFLIAAGIMITRKLPAILTLPIMGLAIAGGAALIQFLLGVDSTRAISTTDLLGGVLADGALLLHVPMIVAFFGGVISFLMQKSGTAESLVKQGAELIGDNPLSVSIFSMLLIAVLFTSIGGLGAIIMVAMVVLPMLATVGISPAVAGGIMLIGISLGGIMNAGNWVIYQQAPMNVKLEDIKSFASILFLLTGLAGITFICVELYRSGLVRSLKIIVATLFFSMVVGGVLVFMISKMIADDDTAPAVGIPVATVSQTDRIMTPGEGVEALALPGEAVFTITNPHEESVTFFAFERDGSLAEDDPLFPGAWHEGGRLGFTYRSSQPGRFTINLIGEEGVYTREFAVQDNAQGKQHIAEIPLVGLRNAGISQVDRVEFTFRSHSDLLELSGPSAVNVGGLSISQTITMPIWLIAARVSVGLFILFLVGTILLDIQRRIKRWRHQVVTIKWYAYLIPVVPLLLIMVYNVAPLTAFLIGIAYAVLATVRPGSISMTIQALIQGSSAVIPAVMLMVGIGILIRAVLGPVGWEEAHGGNKWPVLAAIGPIFQQIVPSGPLGYVVTFGLCAPLALYRGPLNVWGLGYGIAALLLTSGHLGGAAVMAMLLTVGQVQGICDPTNTHNVWLANELRVDVQTLMWKTIPYIWGMVFVGLTIAAFMYMR